MSENTLTRLLEVLHEATACGMLDDLAKYVHPDVINTFCDAVEAMAKDHDYDTD